MHRSMRGKANKLRPRQGSRRRVDGNLRSDVNVRWMLLWLRYRFSIFHLSLCFVTHKTSTKVVPGCNREIHSHQQATICRYKLKKTVFDTWYDALFQVEIGKDQKPTGDTLAAIGVSLLTISSSLAGDVGPPSGRLANRVGQAASGQGALKPGFPDVFLRWSSETPGRQRRSSLSPSLLCRACWCFWRHVWVDDIFGVLCCETSWESAFYSYSMLCQDSVEVRCRKCDEAQAGKSLHRFSWKLQTGALISIDQALVSDCIGDAVKEYTQAPPCDEAGGDALESKKS